MGNLLFNQVFPISLHIALFFSSNTIYKAADLAEEVSKELSDVISNKPDVIDLPPEAPIELPDIFFKNDEIGQLLISRARANCTLLLKSNVDFDYIRKISVYIERLANCLVDKGNIRIVRIGIVLTCSTDQSITMELVKSKFISNEKLSETCDLELAWLRRVKLGNLNLNRWVRLDFSALSEIDNRIVIDINTLADEELDINEYPIKQTFDMLFDQIRSEFDDIIEW